MAGVFRPRRFCLDSSSDGAETMISETPWGPLPGWIIYTLTVILGSCVGSFANVLIYRLPREESLVRPPSRCPACGRRIRPWENIPVLSWILLGGRCRGCHSRISWLYPAVELGSAGLAVLAVSAWGFTYAGFAYGMLFIALLALIIIDLEHWLLPFAITVPIAIIGLIGSIAFAMRPLADSLLGMAVGFAIFMLMMIGGKALFKREAMGGGDVVFGIMAGVYLGWKLTIFMIFAASLLGTLAALPLALTGRKISGRSLPFGPFLAVAMIISLYFGDTVIRWYIGLIGG
ncbi:MAG: prepilin peptidase [bacterium]|nr:prepilin peptidase [bacterium]